MRRSTEVNIVVSTQQFWINLIGSHGVDAGCWPDRGAVIGAQCSQFPAIELVSADDIVAEKLTACGLTSIAATLSASAMENH
jgi:hypothetical protein